jgi:hypothetical protein
MQPASGYCGGLLPRGFRRRVRVSARGTMTLSGSTNTTHAQIRNQSRRFEEFPASVLMWNRWSR